MEACRKLQKRNKSAVTLYLKEDSGLAVQRFLGWRDSPKAPFGDLDAAPRSAQ